MAEYLEPIKIHLPENIEDLKKFAVFGREKLTAVRAEIRAIKKVGLAMEVYDQKLHEAQGIAEAVLDAECKIGALMDEVPKATPNNNPFHEIPDTRKLASKTESLNEFGFNKNQQSQFQQLAKNTDYVETAKELARNEGRIVTRSDALKAIKEYKETHKEFNELNRIDKERNDIRKKFDNSVNSLSWFKIDDFSIRAIMDDTTIDEVEKRIDDAIGKLNRIRVAVDDLRNLKILEVSYE